MTANFDYAGENMLDQSFTSQNSNASNALVGRNLQVKQHTTNLSAKNQPNEEIYQSGEQVSFKLSDKFLESNQSTPVN